MGLGLEFDVFVPMLVDMAIRGLLRILGSDGSTAKPTLMHWGLWYTNWVVDEDTGEVLL